MNTVQVRENGPLAVHAPVVLAGAREGYRVTLCRCGASGRKPFWDGSHAAAGFTASGEPTARDSQALVQRDGPLHIEPVADGPLHVQRSLEVATGTGKTINPTMECWLCRCGQSRDEPYCDGSHKAAGFRSEGR